MSYSNNFDSRGKTPEQQPRNALLFKIEAVLNCLFGHLDKTKLYYSNADVYKITRIGTMVYNGTQEEIVVEQHGVKSTLTGLSAKLVYKLI